MRKNSNPTSCHGKPRKYRRHPIEINQVHNEAESSAYHRRHADGTSASYKREQEREDYRQTEVDQHRDRHDAGIKSRWRGQYNFAHANGGNHARWTPRTLAHKNRYHDHFQHHEDSASNYRCPKCSARVNAGR